MELLDYGFHEMLTKVLNVNRGYCSKGKFLNQPLTLSLIYVTRQDRLRDFPSSIPNLKLQSVLMAIFIPSTGFYLQNVAIKGGGVGFVRRII